ncbi:hypothetical protein KDW67_17185, partial [Burkholderia cenocepacia]|uniref:hypothetical protein n=1 Tax=Burkholderia cenocepacia TaxID=95486 RepID=UPI001B9DD332
DAAYHLAASSQSVRHSVRRAIHRRHQLRSFNRPQHTKFLTRPVQAHAARASSAMTQQKGALVAPLFSCAYR